MLMIKGAMNFNPAMLVGVRNDTIKRGLKIGSRSRWYASSSATAVRKDVNETSSNQDTQPQDAHTGDSSDGSAATYSQTGSAKLFADALLEEEEASSSSSSSSSSSESSSRTSSSREANRAAQLIQQHTQGENWTGEESIQDAVLRMLVDKYKPLRGPIIRSAEEKIKENPPSIRSTPTGATSEETYKANWEKRKEEPLLPAVEGHRPWNTTFTPPSTLTARVKLGVYAPSSARRPSRDGLEDGVKVDVAAARRSATAQRLGRARESTQDYKLGLSPRSSSSQPRSAVLERRRPPPAGLKAWSNIIEERIEHARHEGQFSTLKGRGKPLVKETAESNPFIAREEFLMNRIVQRNQAAPAWVELQGELETAIRTFRTILRQSWTRRAILSLTSSRPPSSLSSLTLSDTRALRDPAWIQRESGYHASALGEVNELVRRYNGVAPYAVRKPYFVKEVELERCFWESGEDVLEGIRERLRKGDMTKRGVRAVGDDEDARGGGRGTGAGEDGGRRIGVWETIRVWIASLRA